MRRALLVSLILFAGGLCGSALELPPLRGDLRGSFHLRKIPAASPILWELRAQPERHDTNRFLLTAKSTGLHVVLQLDLPRNGGEGHWRVVEGVVDPKPWMRVFINAFGLTGVPADLVVQGELTISGEGELKGTQLTGTVVAAMQGASVESAEQQWSVADLDLEARINLGSPVPYLAGVTLRAPRAEVTGVVLDHVDVAITGDSEQRLRVERAQVGMWSGRVALRPFSFDLSKPAIRATAELDRVALENLAALVPETISEGHGSLNGTVEFSWSAAKGLQAGRGNLRLSPGAPTTLRLAAAPSLLTSHVPRKIEWVPSALGPIARWLALDNPAYETLRRIEMGEMPLTVNVMSVELYPDGPDGSTSVRVKMSARPEDGSVVDEVSFQVNVTGPINEVMQLGADDRVHFGGSTK